MKVRDLLKILEELTSEPCIKTYEEELNNALVFGNEDDVVKGIVIVWKPTINIIKKAVELKANVIISHESLFYEYKPYLTKGRNIFTIPANLKKIELLTKYKINVIRYHTKWDDAENGNNDTLLKLLDLELIEKYPCMRIAKLKKPLRAIDFAKLVKERLKSPYVKFVGNKEKLIERVLIIAGAGAKNISFLDFALQKRCDAIVSGDSIADTQYFSYENDLVLIDPGHQYLEQWGMKSLAEILEKKLNVPVYFIENENVVSVL